ncbi:MAG TPA: TMEM175 family protein [Flavobacteriaceae bacterium]|nr:DUF1211 domain-containing protein [Flavobacteriaceae bacterium]MCB9213346.1 DUF1211 domain-containing protein [Alteromonas sp.]HPF10237.1 TMEM175 family protein [Flavobacteriaceae bacterium]HQU20683.1 TMEM175 family protein [Flavobacteriaceae bacterium]HQU64899.1 TMEM175 family protein [Flavobacteriaceae bacterium]
MRTGRLEAFSDGVLAIVITIMVLELKAPKEVTLEALSHEWPVFASYLFSFIYLGIYWNNHHHLFQITEKVNGKILWANLHLLFWLSLVPFTTSWLGENHLDPTPVALYGFNLLMSAVAYFILQGAILRFHGDDFILKKQIGKDWKGKMSLVFYVLGLSLSFWNTWLAIGFYVLVAIMWIVPDRRIEKHIS